MTTSRINQVSFSFFSKSQILHMARTVDKFFTREMVKIAIRGRNPEISPRLNELIFKTSI